mgnify:CR=1 FL=1
MIPIKDASLIARCDDSNLRRIWRSRLVDHDGEAEGEGGIARWLKLTEGLGLDTPYVESMEGALPATRNVDGVCIDGYVARSAVEGAFGVGKKNPLHQASLGPPPRAKLEEDCS